MNRTARAQDRSAPWYGFPALFRRRQPVEEALSQSAARYRVFFQGLSEGAAFCKMLYDDQGQPADWVYLEANQALERLLGGNDLTGKRASELFPALRKSNPELFEMHGRVALTGQPEELEGWLQPLGLWVRMSVNSPEKDHFFAIIENINERKQAEQEQARLAAIVESSTDAIISVNPEGIIESWNKAAERLYQYTQAEAIGQPVSILELPGNPGDFQKLIQRIQHGERLNTLENIARRKDGSRVDVSLSLSPIQDAAGRRMGISGVVRDITERKRAEQALRESEEQFRAAFEISSVGMCQAEPHSGRLLRVNRRFCEMSGYSEAELLNRPFSDFTHPDDRPSNFEQYLRLVRGEISEYHVVKRYLHKDESVWWGEVTVSLVTAHNGQPLRTIAIIKDITDSQRASDQLQANEAQLRVLFDQTIAGLAQTNLTGRFLMVNDRYCEIVGRSRAELLGLRMQDITHPDDLPGNLADFQRIVTQGGNFAVRKRYLRPDGSIVWVHNQVNSILDANGQPATILAVVADITTHKQAEESLRESEERFRIMADGTPLIIWVTDSEGGLEFGNRAYYEFFGPTLNAARFEDWRPLIHPDDGAYVEEFISALRVHQPYYGQARVRRADAEWRWIESYGQPRFSSSGEFLGMAGSSLDITERRRAEEALRESEARMAGIINSAMDAIISVDDQHGIVLFNQAAEKMFGYTAAEMLGQPVSRLVPLQYRDAHEQHIRRFGARGQTARKMGALTAVSGLRRNGEEFPVEASISQLQVDGQKFFTVILRDITERLQANERLIEQATLLDQAHDAIIVRDLNHCIRYWGSGAERLYGWTAQEAIGRSAAELMYRENLAALTDTTRALIERGEWRGEMNHLTRDYREVTVEARWTLVRDEAGKPKNILAINTDVTEKKKIESQFLRAQRMESIGTLAGGIAHDLNNVLAPILLAIRTLQQRFTDEESQQWLSLVRQSTERGRDMLAQVLTFARGATGERLALNPVHLVNGTVSILKETFPKNIAVQVLLPEDLWEVVGDSTQLHQVLLNLCLNARDAMPDGGQLSITVENLLPNFPKAKMPRTLSKQCVCITVADTGIGIPANLLDRIFEPFFTTKPPGQGTGLGLATTLGIIKSHGGWIDVSSKVGAGTQFKIYLPANNAAPAEPSATPASGLHSGNGELILVVEDESEVREITKATLEAFGYRVLAASNGQQALALYAAHQNEIQAVLTDVIMPILDGVELAQSLSQLFPSARVIVTSGLPFTGHFSAESQLNISAFLSKPYSAEILLSTLAEVLTSTH